MNQTKIVSIALITGGQLIDLFDVIPSQISTFITENSAEMTLIFLCFLSGSALYVTPILLFKGFSWKQGRSNP